MSINPKPKNLNPDRAIELNSGVWTKVPLRDGRITFLDPDKVAIIELESKLISLAEIVAHQQTGLVKLTESVKILGIEEAKDE